MNIFKLISFFYLFLLSVALLVPLDFFFVTQIVEAEKHPSNKMSFLIHLFLFFILYSLLIFSFSNRDKILYFCISYGVIIETLQVFTSRGFQFLDIIFNIVGVLISFLVIKFFLKNNI